MNFPFKFNPDPPHQKSTLHAGMNHPQKWVCSLLLLPFTFTHAQSVSQKPNAQGYFTLYDPRAEDYPRARFSTQEQAKINRLAESAARRGLFSTDAEMDAEYVCTPQNFTLDDRAQGSFTRPGLKETAYLYRNCMNHDTYLGSGIVIYRGQQLVAHAILSPGYTLRVSPDINRNGRNELLLISLEMHMGYDNSIVQLLEFTGNHLSRLGAWKVEDGDCSGSMTRLSTTVLKVKPGQRFKILGDVYKGNCQTQKRVSRDKPVAPAP